MVCEAFHGTQPPDLECRHENGVASDNVPSNLRWGTRLDNQRDRIAHGTTNEGESNGRAKITAALAKKVYERALSGEVRDNIAKETGVSKSMISLIAGGFRWSSVTGAPKRGR